MLRDHGQPLEANGIHGRPRVRRQTQRPAPRSIGQRIALVVERRSRLELSASRWRIVLPDNKAFSRHPRSPVKPHEINIGTLPARVNEDVDDAVRVRTVIQPTHSAGHRACYQSARTCVQHRSAQPVNVREWTCEARVYTG